MKTGTLKADGLIVAEINITFLRGPAPKMDAKAAIVNSSAGQTHGWTTASGNWSPETLERLAALRESMESDMAKEHFVQEKGLSTIGGSTPNNTTGSGDGGLGEHLGGEEVPSV